VSVLNVVRGNLSMSDRECTRAIHGNTSPSLHTSPWVYLRASWQHSSIFLEN